MRITEIVIDVSCRVCVCVWVWVEEREMLMMFVDRALNRMLRVRLCQDGAFSDLVSG